MTGLRRTVEKGLQKSGDVPSRLSLPSPGPGQMVYAGSGLVEPVDFEARVRQARDRRRSLSKDRHRLHSSINIGARVCRMEVEPRCSSLLGDRRLTRRRRHHDSD